MEKIEGNCTKGKKNFLVKTWNRCQSFPGIRSNKSCHDQEKTKKKIVAPEGYFPVYVGHERQRFNVKTKYANHPLFMMLLEDAKTEHGYNSSGPISLPCYVDLFYKVLAEMEANEVQPLGWGFAYGSCSPFNPSRRLGSYGAHHMGKGYGSYEPLTPSRLIKMN
ncbi:auxin-responsive protein SAUR71-like [Rutidosis leptorrhynchoides]|uniref:auxin-responsive protein SAUR71-like n=1 Tax=Rutidosis leptorrhynchoides TaxID=125765 RepID=UPI003A9A1D38